VPVERHEPGAEPVEDKSTEGQSNNALGIITVMQHRLEATEHMVHQETASRNTAFMVEQSLRANAH
jgi:hypothetical protein